MSRTRAHRPYWVVENDEGTVIDHDHRFFGMPVYGPYRRKRGSNGRFLRQMEDITVPASTILRYTWDADAQNVWPNKYTLAHINEARKMRDLGDYYAPIVIGQKLGYVYERKLLGHVPDHCVIGLNTEGYKPRDTAATCYPALSDHQAATYNWGRYRSGRYYRNQDSRTRRRYARDELVSAAKLYNNGDEMDDYDFGIHVGVDRWIWD